MEFDPKFWPDFLLYGSLLFVALLAVLLYLCLVASAHMRAKMAVDIYLEIGRQVQRQEDLRRTTGEAPSLGTYLEMHSLVRNLLEEEGLLKKPDSRK